MKRTLIAIIVCAALANPAAAATRRRDKRIPTKADVAAALAYIDHVTRTPQWQTLIDYRALGRSTIERASAGDCDALRQIVRYLDPGNYPRWITIIEHEGADFAYGQCAPIAQLSGGPGRGWTQQTIGWNDDAGGKVTRYWHGLYYAIGAVPDAWSNAYFHMRVSVNHMRRHGWSAWNGAY